MLFSDAVTSSFPLFLSLLLKKRSFVLFFSSVWPFLRFLFFSFVLFFFLFNPQCFVECNFEYLYLTQLEPKSCWRRVVTSTKYGEYDATRPYRKLSRT